jgi:DNA-binding CsgD family transcriptional regulator
MSFELVGREQELAAIDTFLYRSSAGPAALVLEGEAGIGKTTLWLAGVEAASSRASHVLIARPAEAEQDLLHAGLADLLDGVLTHVLPALPAPRRHALEVALLLRESDEPARDERAVGAAVHTALGMLAEAGLVVVAIDDVQWLDSSSVRALEFALRRLYEEPVLVLLARRVELEPSPTPLGRVLPADCVENIHVGLLSLGAIQRLLQTRLQRTFSRRTLLRLYEVSGGNPFYALELAHSLDPEEPSADPTEPIQVPETLEAVIQRRLGALPKRTRTALLTVAALGAPPSALVRAAGVSDQQLEPAFSTHVIEHTNGEIRFAHPLLASVLYGAASPAQRQQTHRLLADVVDDPVSRARHLALGARLPDPRVATELEHAAGLARSRGAVIVAAELGELAVRATAAEAADDVTRRQLQTARDYVAAGDPVQAKALVQDVLARPREADNAQVLTFLGELDLLAGGTVAGIDRLELALSKAADDPALQARIHLELSWVVRLNRDLVEGGNHVDQAVELASQVGDLALLSRALAAHALFRRSVLESEALALAHEAVGVARESGDRSALDETRKALADVLLWTGRFDDARSVLEELYESAHSRDELELSDALWYLSLLELWVGQWAEAEEHAEQCREIGSFYSVEDGDVPNTLFPAALVAAHRGDAAVARELGERGLELAERKGQQMFVVNHRAVLGIVEFREGEPLLAVGHFDRAEASRQARQGLLEPNMRFYYGDYVEALLELGRVEDAAGIVDRWASEAHRLGRGWALAHANRCRGLLAAARGDNAEALRLLEEALAMSSAGGPFATARAALALGIVLRRARQKRKAREALEKAIHHFDSLGAPHWSKRAANELARVGGRAPSGLELTPAERRVAELVAEGKTNREVAGMLHLAERTVEGHLSHIYAKLGLRSRTELSRRLG